MDPIKRARELANNWLTRLRSPNTAKATGTTKFNFQPVQQTAQKVGSYFNPVGPSGLSRDIGRAVTAIGNTPISTPQGFGLNVPLPTTPLVRLADVESRVIRPLLTGISPEGKLPSLPPTLGLTADTAVGLSRIGSTAGYYLPKVTPVATRANLAVGQTGGVSIQGIQDRLLQLLPSLGKTISKITQPVPKTPVPPTVVGGQRSVPKTSTSLGTITDPVQKIIQALKEAKPIRVSQEALYSAERAKRVARVASLGEKVPGEKGYFAQLGQLKGELPKAQFESIRKQFTQGDVDSLFNMVEGTPIFSPFEKVTAKTGLAKLLGGQGGVVPTENELKLLGEVFPVDFVEAVLSNRTLTQKLLSIGGEILNLPRAIMSTLDLSAPLRQGVFLVGRPKQFVPAFKEMFRYAASENAYKGLTQQLQTRSTYKLMRQTKLAITDMSPLMSQREEAFMSNLSEKIPGFGVLAKASNRAYSGFLNKLRADVFDDLVRTAKKQGLDVEGKLADDIARFVNSATGRGSIGVLNKAAPILNATLFSPRLLASRLNLLNPQYYVALDPFVRKEALKSLLTFGATASTVLGIAKLGGAEVGTDPRSADFGKIKMGNTRYDTLGGFQQYLKLGAQLLSGQVVSSSTGKVITLGEGYKPLTRKDILMRFFESKEAPIASLVTALLTGQTAVGEPVDLTTEMVNRFIPMVVQDIYDIAKDKDDVGQALIMAMPGVFGVGSQTYGKTELVTGQNKIEESTAQIRPIQGLGETITEGVFGTRSLGTSSTHNVESYYDQMLQLPKEQAMRQFEDIRKVNPDLAKKISQVAKDREKGVTVEDQTLRDKGVASGDRATELVKKFNKLSTKEEKAKLWQHYVDIGVITPEVGRQITRLLQNSLK